MSSEHGDDAVVPTTPFRARRTVRLYPLTAKEIQFCHSILEGNSASEAYREHIARSDNVAQSTVESGASRVLKRDSIRAYIRKCAHESANAAMVTGSALVAKLRGLGLTDFSGIFDDKNRLLPRSQWPPGIAEFLVIESEEEWKNVYNEKSGEWEEVRIRWKTKVKVPKAIDALNTLARILKMIGENSKIDLAEDHIPLTIGGQANRDAV